MFYLTRKRIEWKSCAVQNYHLLDSHDNDFIDFTILCWDNNGLRLLLNESILITRDFPVLNKKNVLFHYYYQWDWVNFI